MHEAFDEFIGRFREPATPQFSDVAGVVAHEAALC